MDSEKEIFHGNHLTELIEKYNVSGPRYTSYPTAVQFDTNFDSEILQKEFRFRKDHPQPYSLYIHIPFCFSLCWYCGCTKVITKDQNRGTIYLDFLEKEINLISKQLHPDSSLKQIHFGGGTPTFLNPKQIQRLGQMIRRSFPTESKLEFSVEIDPRRVSEDHICALAEIGCNRASLGIQDTNPEVQEAIHRIQPIEQTQNVVQLLRKHGIHHLNFDLIYGLPKQSRESFKKTLHDTLQLNPDRYAVYSYAHIPSVMPAQKLLAEESFPSSREKLSMLSLAIDDLKTNGYAYIGMDHFAKETDELSVALREGSLHRNFQGYSTFAELDMIALGMSGISQSSRVFYQNTKSLEQYYSNLDEGRLPVVKGYVLTPEDKIRKNIIMQIMCKGVINYADFLKETGIDIPEKYPAEIDTLSKFESDGLLITSANGFHITKQGRLFLRNIAMVFDEYLKHARRRTAYSKTI